MYPAREQETPLAHTAHTRAHTHARTRAHTHTLAHKLEPVQGSGAAPGFVPRRLLGSAERRHRRKARGVGGGGVRRDEAASSRTAKLPRARRRP